MEVRRGWTQHTQGRINGMAPAPRHASPCAPCTRGTGLASRGAVVGDRSNGGGGRAVESVEERAVVDIDAADQQEGGLHRLLARRVGDNDIDGAAAVGVGEPGERGSGLDGQGEPVGAGGVGEDGLEEGRHRQRVGEQEGV
eukprot:scaffold47680_cov60-Phaeocystis_antarctica.AAC.3